MRKYYRYTTLNCATTGTLTNNRGVVSGFSSANYLKTIPSNISFHEANNWEICFKFTFENFNDSDQTLFCQPVGYPSHFLITSNKNLALYINTTGNSTYVCQLFSTNILEEGKTYYAHCGFTGTEYYIDYSLDNETWIDRVSYESTTKLTNRGDWIIGMHNQSGYYNPLLGLLFLNESYIKINGKIIWKGANAEEIGTPADYDFYKDYNEYNLFPVTVRHYYKTKAFPRPNLSTNGIMGGNKFACNESNFQLESSGLERRAFYLFDLSNSTRWQINNISSQAINPPYVEWYNPEPLTTTSLIMQNVSENYPVKNYVLYGSNTYGNWTQLASGTNTETSASGTWEVVIPSDKQSPYRYFRMTFTATNNTSIMIGGITINATYTVETTSSDYDTYEDKIEYTTFKKSNRKYYKYTSWTQPVLTSNGTIGENSFACNQSNLYSSEYAYLAFDGNTNTQFTNNGNRGSFFFYNPKPLKITNIEITNGFQSGYVRAISSGTLYASLDNANWTRVKEFTNTNTDVLGVWSIDLSTNTKAYKYFKLNVNGDGSYARITEMKITATEANESTSSDYDYYEDKNTYSLLEQQPLSNILTYIPQDIKLVLANNTLTLKTGSKIYFPDGFEQDGTTPKFTSIITNKDVNIGATGGTGYVLICVNKNLSGNASSGVNNCVSGNNVTPVSYGMTYDTATNIITRYGSGTTHSIDNASFPLALVYQVNQVHTSIEQVFNGFGYIGNTIYSLPGIKSLIPNGRNDNRTIKTIAGETQKVHKTIVNDTWNRNNQPFFLTETATEFTGTSNDNYYPYKNASIQDTKTYATYYDENSNLMYHSSSTAGEYDIVNYCFSGYFTITNGRISNLRVRPVNI